MPQCRSCKAPVRFVPTTRGKEIILDPEPSPRGNVIISDDGFAVVVKPGEGVYLSHFATCPDAGKFRKGGRPCRDR